MMRKNMESITVEMLENHGKVELVELSRQLLPNRLLTTDKLHVEERRCLFE